MALLSYAWGKDRCFPGQETLAHDVGAGKRSVIRYLQELQEVGLLEIKRRGLGLTNVYILKKIAVTSRSAKMALQEMPKTTPPEMPEWHSEEYKEEEYEERINVSNIRKRNRSNKKENGLTVAHQTNLAEQAEPVSSNRAITQWNGVEGIGEEIKRKRGRPRKYSDDVSQTILNYVADFSREFADKATVNQSAARFINDFHKWGRGDMDAFVGILYQARSITKSQGGIRGSKFAYFASVVEDLLGLRADDAAPAYAGGAPE